MSVQMSAVERLRSLPDVFTSNNMSSIFGMSRASVDNTIARWRKAGLVETMGMRKAGVHFNLLRRPDAHDALMSDALWLLLRVPHVLGGGGALHAAGWTTQRHHVHEVCVGVSTRSPCVPTGLTGVNVLARPIKWMSILFQNAEANEQASGGIPMLSPAMALADSWLANQRGTGRVANTRMAWLPDSDDVEIPSEEEWMCAVDCLRLLGASDEEVADFTNTYENSVEDTNALSI